MQIAVKCPNWVGDVVMATAALKSIRQSFPDDRISAIVRPGYADLLEGCSSCDEILSVDETGLRVFPEGLRLRRCRFDTAIVLPRSFRAALLMRVSGTPRRIGFAASCRGFLLTDTVDYEPRTNTRDMYLRICRAAGCSQITGDISLAVSAVHEKRAEELLSSIEGRPIAGIVPGGSYGSAKLWPVEHFARAAEIIKEQKDARFVVLHGPGEADIAREIAEASGAALTVSEGLGVLKSVVKRLDLLLTNDTGPRHIGVAFSVPTVVLMGPTRPEYTNYPAENLSVLREEVDCGPCQLKVCPRNHECMRNLSPERVARECMNMIESVPKEGQ